jgi:histidinol-phosphate/aromatic aminotransferase/cobyric acid decarboxylase-like protein
VGNPALIREIERARGPYKVASVSEAAAVAALTEGLPWVKEHAAIAVGVRERFADALRARGLEPVPSAANFLFVPMANAPVVAQRMRELGVAVRGFAQPAGLRINVAPWDSMQDALSALDQARRECA